MWRNEIRVFKGLVVLCLSNMVCTITAKADLIFCSRFIGSAKVYLNDLASGQVKSLPSKNLPLVSESGQNIGVSPLTSSVCFCLCLLFKNDYSYFLLIVHLICCVHTTPDLNYFCYYFSKYTRMQNLMPATCSRRVGTEAGARLSMFYVTFYLLFFWDLCCKCFKFHKAHGRQQI